MSAFVQIRNLHKFFGSTEVLKGIDLDFHRGEIHAFVGANGAGKSTFINCLCGGVVPDQGEIRLGEAVFHSFTPRQAIEQGIGVIHQHSQIIPDLTVADNLFLGKELRRAGVLDAAEQNRQTVQLLERLGHQMDPKQQVHALSVGERQLISIARALRLNPHLLILDEPTAALSTHEIEALHKVVRYLAGQENIAVVYISHLLDEIKALAHQVTVLRDGRIVWTKDAADVTVSAIAQAISPSVQAVTLTASGTDQSICQLDQYQCGYAGPIDLDLKAGEIVGIYGLLGSGRSDLLETLYGARPLKGGTLAVGGRQVCISSPRQAQKSGLALVAADRTEQSLFGEMSASDNVLLPHCATFARTARQRRSLFQHVIDNMSLNPPDPNLAGNRFSGGNAQKLVMGRWLMPQAGVRILLLDEPTQGVDVGARDEIYRLLAQIAQSGSAILMASSDPSELVMTCNRVLVLCQGQQVAILEHGFCEEDLIDHAHRNLVAVGAHG